MVWFSPSREVLTFPEKKSPGRQVSLMLLLYNRLKAGVVFVLDPELGLPHRRTASLRRQEREPTGPSLSRNDGRSGSPVHDRARAMALPSTTGRGLSKRIGRTAGSHFSKRIGRTAGRL